MWKIVRKGCKSVVESFKFLPINIYTCCWCFTLSVLYHVDIFLHRWMINLFLVCLLYKIKALHELTILKYNFLQFKTCLREWALIFTSHKTVKAIVLSRLNCIWWSLSLCWSISHRSRRWLPVLLCSRSCSWLHNALIQQCPDWDGRRKTSYEQ